MVTGSSTGAGKVARSRNLDLGVVLGALDSMWMERAIKARVKVYNTNLFMIR